MRALRAPLLTAALAATTLLITACDQAGGGRADQPAVAGDQVDVVDNAFEPSHLEVTVGDTVTWTWQGRAAHDVVGDDFASEAQRDGTFTHTFEEPGEYDYECTLHPRMTGQITVTDA